MSESADYYKTQFATLKNTIETLKSNQEPDIDAIIPMADKAINAYKNCKARLDAVKTGFAERMSGFGETAL